MLFKEISLILILLLIEVVIFVLSLKRTNFNFLFPANIIQLTLLGSTIFYLFGVNLWSNTLQINTFCLLVFVFIICLVSTLLYKKSKMKIKIWDIKFKNLYFKLQMLTIISFVCLIFYALNIFLISIQYGISFYAAINKTKAIGGGYSAINTIFRQGYKVVTMISFVSSYLLFYNIKNKRYVRMFNFLCLINIMMSVVIVILSSSRADILKQIAVFFFFMIYFVERKNLKKFFKFFILFFVCFLLLFYLSRNMVKSFTGGYSDLTLFEYITFYIASPIEVLNIKLQNYEEYRNIYLGYNLFSNLYNSLIDLNLIGEAKDINQFVYIGNLAFGGNVGTFILPFIIDFGCIGGIFLIVIYVLIVNKIYIYSNEKGHFALWLNVYIFSLICFSFYDSMIYQFFDINTLLNFIVLYILYKYIFTYKKIYFINENQLGVEEK